MLEIKGKYASAKIMTDNIEPEAMKQIYAVCNAEYSEGTKIVIMPDVHAGAGCVIGFTQQLNSKDIRICPNLIGVDIGCSVSATKLPIKELDVVDFEKYVRKNIPLGTGGYSGENAVLKISANEAATLLSAEAMMKEDGGSMKTSVLYQLGSLGSGNHFIEAGKDSDGKICILIHSGSRNFGLSVCKTYQRHAEERIVRDCPTELRYLDKSSEFFERYMKCLYSAQLFAELNHKLIRNKILEYFVDVNPLDIKGSIYTRHNYVDFAEEIPVVRKGAIKADYARLVLIPFNMQEGTAICMGLGKAEWNYSAPHGAGRLMSRSRAKKELDINKVKREMEEAGVYTTSIDYALDEAKDAYKPMNEIMGLIRETVDVLDVVKPICNIKGA